MPRAPRQMRLAAEHVRRLHREVPDPGPQLPPDTRSATDADYDAEMFATACGYVGSMAHHLHSTIEKLEELGIHDGNLRRLQALVAERIEFHYPADREV